MAESVDSMHFAANSKTNSPKPLIAKRPPESRPPSSSDIYPPPPKKVRVEEKGLKHRKLNGELCAGEKHNGKQSCGSPAKWSFGPAKESHSTAAAVPAAPARKIFKISNFLASPHKVKKAKEKRHKEKEKSSEAQRSSAAAAAAVEKLSPASCHTKTENGDVKMLQRGRRAPPARSEHGSGQPAPRQIKTSVCSTTVVTRFIHLLPNLLYRRPTYLLGPDGDIYTWKCLFVSCVCECTLHLTLLSAALLRSSSEGERPREEEGEK